MPLAGSIPGSSTTEQQKTTLKLYGRLVLDIQDYFDSHSMMKIQTTDTREKSFIKTFYKKLNFQKMFNFHFEKKMSCY